MPIYEYVCPSCGHEFEKLQKMGASAPSCPDCGVGETQRRVSLSAFHLKGNGWYSTDYKASPGPTTGDGDGGSSGSDSSGSGGDSASSGGGGAHSCGTGCGCAH